MAEIKRRSDAFSRVGSPQRMMAMNASDTARLVDLRIAEVKPDPGNPRRAFPETEIAELSSSLKKHGLLQPIVVRKIENEYIILAGERRWRAAQLAGFISIKAIVHTDSRTAANVLIAQVIENDQRAPLSTSELVDAVARLLETGLTITEIAAELSMQRTLASKLKALGALPDELKPHLDTMGVDPLYELLQQHKADAGSVNAMLETGKAPTRAELRDAKRAKLKAVVESPAAADKKVDAASQKSSKGDAAAPARTDDLGALAPGYRDRGSIIVRHGDHGEGRVIFGLKTSSDRLPVLFVGSAEPIQALLSELAIVATK